jgi:hypothetical protein
MKRTRKQTKIKSSGFFPVAEVIKEVKRQRKPKGEDPFIVRHEGKTASEILLDFLKARRKYVNKNYPKQTQVVLMELDLYEDIVLRLVKSKVLI